MGLSVVAMVGMVGIVGVGGGGTAYAQECDPVEMTELLASDGAPGDCFGYFVSIDSDTALVGALWDDDNGIDSGSAYIFDLNCTDCPADINDDGVVNTQDFILFNTAWAVGDPLADWNGDGIVNTQDFVAFLIDWAAGC